MGKMERSSTEPTICCSSHPPLDYCSSAWRRKPSPLVLDAVAVLGHGTDLPLGTLPEHIPAHQPRANGRHAPKSGHFGLFLPPLPTRSAGYSSCHRNQRAALQMSREARWMRRGKGGGCERRRRRKSSITRSELNVPTRGSESFLK